jgi:hypothetical protein
MNLTKAFRVAPALLLLSCSSHQQPEGTRQTTPAVKEGVARLSDALHECHERHGVSGYVQAQITIESGGGVSAVELDPKVAGTPGGACIREVLLKQGHFDVDHGPIIIRYPLLLR